MTRVLFISSNGIGMGHLTRTMAIARRLPEGFVPIILTMSKGMPTARSQGFFTEYFPSKKASGLDERVWTAALATRVSGMIQEYEPALVAFDGIFPYRGVRRALDAHPDPVWVWIRRAMWRPDTGAEQLEYSPIFDAILEPGEFAREADTGLTAARREEDEVVEVAPIVYCGDDELVPREEAEAQLGLEHGKVNALIQVGEVPREQRDLLMQTCASQILQRQGTQVAILESAISATLTVPPAVVKIAATYPIARLYRAFDFVISAAGYNSYHELIKFRIPAAFYPVRKPTDNQHARATYAADAGVGIGVGVDVTRAIERLLTESDRRRISSRAKELGFADGGQQAADEIARLASAARATRAVPAAGRLELASVSAAQLAALDRVGPATAQRIIEFRDRNGVSSIEDLLRVRGVGPATLEALRAHLKA